MGYMDKRFDLSSYYFHFFLFMKLALVVILFFVMANLENLP